MPIHDDPDDPVLAAACERTRWFEAVLEVEYGEREANEAVPPALNWLSLLPPVLQLGLDDAECSLAYTSDTTGYRCVVWEVTGEDDRPWIVFLVDDFGVRLLNEYSALDEEISDNDLDVILARAANDLPDRLLRGEFDRAGDPLPIPSFLMPSDLPEETDADPEAEKETAPEYGE
ncbi:MAG: hypothetical protein OHK0029_22650 [Armatimonadaceae bacterium]